MTDCMHASQSLFEPPTVDAGLRERQKCSFKYAQTFKKNIMQLIVMWEGGFTITFLHFLCHLQTDVGEA